MGQAVNGWWQAAISERDPGEEEDGGGCADVLLLCRMGGCCYHAKSLQAGMEDGRMVVGEEEGCVMEQTDALREREALHKKRMQVAAWPAAVIRLRQARAMVQQRVPAIKVGW